MLSVDFNEISAINARGAQIDRVYAGSDIVWTESEPMRFIVELSGGQLCAFDLSAIDEEYESLHPFSVTWPHGVFSDPFRVAFGASRISAFTPITKIRDNQSTSAYGIDEFASVEGLSDLQEAVLPKATLVYENAFRGCKSLRRLCLTNVSAVASNAFIGCTNLSSIQLPSLVYLGQGAFTYCSSLVSVDLGKIDCVPVNAFYNTVGVSSFSNLRYVSAPHAICADVFAFKDANSLQKVYLPSLQHIGIEAFLHCSSLSAVDVENVVDVQRSGLESTGVESFIMPNCISVDERGIAFNQSLKFFYGPMLKTVGRYAFYNCSALSSVAIPNAEVLGDYAFADCNLIESMVFSHLKSVGTRALSCNGLDTITIYNGLSDGIPSIGINSLPRRTLIYVADQSVYEQMCTSSGLSSSQDRVILLSCKDKTLEVKAKLSEDQDREVVKQLTVDKTSRNLAATSESGELQAPFDEIFVQEVSWVLPLHPADYTSIIDEGAEVSSLDSNCFQNFTSLSTLHLPNCISIGSNALDNCSSLVDLDLNSLQTAGQNSFRGLLLSSIELPSLVSAYGAFVQMPELKSLKLPALASSSSPLVLECSNLSVLELQNLSSIDIVMSDNLTALKILALPKLTAINQSIAPPSSRPSGLSAIDLASISYEDFATRLSVQIARGGFAPGCTLTCSDGVFVIA